jgi:hypothetical protein
MLRSGEKEMIGVKAMTSVQHEDVMVRNVEKEWVRVSRSHVEWERCMVNGNGLKVKDIYEQQEGWTLMWQNSLIRMDHKLPAFSP